MIDDDELRALLAEAAEAVPPPGRAPQALLDAIAAEQVARAPRRLRRPRRLTIVAAAAAVVLLGIVVSGTLSQRSSQDFTATGAAIGGGGGTTGSDDDLVDTASPEGEESTGAGSVGQPADSAKVIRTGSLDLEVREGAFRSTVDRIRAQAVGLGGYIAEATTSESGDHPSGSITVRVPGDSFDQLLSDLRELGDVKAVSSKGTDVTAQFTDLEARLEALTATRDRLEAVLAEADTVTDILSVQDRITAVQIEIEQVQGQQKLLQDQTAYGTLAITLGEPGAEVIEVDAVGDGGIGGAWDDARRRFGDNLETIVAWSGSAAVVLVVGLGAILVARVLWVGMRRRLV